MAWLHYADHALDPIRRSLIGSNVPIADTTLERFAKAHWTDAPEKGPGAESTVSNRIKRFYPELFSNLRCRLSALLDIPQCSVFRGEFERLEAAFLFDLTAADRLARKLEGGTTRLHDDYRLAFGSIYDDLRALLIELVEIGRVMKKGR